MAHDAGGSTYSIEYAKSGRAGCKGPKAICEYVDVGRKIEKDTLRVGTHSSTGEDGHDIVSWRHWRCVTAKVLHNIGSPENLAGFHALNDDDQEDVREAFDLGYVPQHKEIEDKLKAIKEADKQAKADEQEAEKAAEKEEREEAKAAAKAEKEAAKKPAAPKKGAKGKKKKAAKEEEEEGDDIDEEAAASEEPEEEEKQKPKKAAAKSKKGAAGKGKKAAGGAKRGRGKQEAKDEEEGGEEEPEAGSEEEEEPAAKKGKAAAKKKPAAKGKKKAAAKGKKGKAAAAEPDADVADEALPADEPSVSDDDDSMGE